MTLPVMFLDVLLMDDSESSSFVDNVAMVVDEKKRRRYVWSSVISTVSIAMEIRFLSMTKSENRV